MLSKQLTIGHHQTEHSGVTVFLLSQACRCAYFLCGGAPATRDIALLDSSHLVTKVNALCFTGGSAFGLGATGGVMQWLKERGLGFKTKNALVPIVPTAAIYDLQPGTIIPSENDGYQACENAVVNNTSLGLLGAGTGAKVGKLAGTPMPGGFGCATLSGPGGLVVSAYVVVNCVGDIFDAQGNILAGARNEEGRFIHLCDSLQQGCHYTSDLQHQQTTLATIFTNAKLSHSALERVSKMASCGLSRAISPALTPYDGDIVFAASLGDLVADELLVGLIAAKALFEAIVSVFQGVAYV